MASPCRRPCVLHAHQYRAVYEAMLNSLSSTLPYYTISSIRSLSCAELCTCAGPLSAFSGTFGTNSLTANGGEQTSVSSCSAAAVSDGGFVSFKPRRSGTEVPPRALADAEDEAVRCASARLEKLAGKRGELADLAPAIARFKSLVRRALAVPRPKRKKSGSAASSVVTSNRARKRAFWQLKQQQHGRVMRRRYFPPPRPRAPPRPYAPLRWPPLAVTMGVLKGRLVPVVRRSTAQQEEQQQPGHDGYDMDGTASDDAEDILDIAESFEAKLRVGRGGRRGSGGGGFHPVDGLMDPKYGPSVLRRGRVSGDVSGRDVAVLLQKQAALQERRQRKAAAAHEGSRGRQDSHLGCLRCSKADVPVAQLWPYR